MVANLKMRKLSLKKCGKISCFVKRYWFKCQVRKISPLPKASLLILAVGIQFMKQELSNLHGRKALTRCIFCISLSWNCSLNT